MTGPVLVTGAAGFAGQHLARLIAAERPVVGWHRPGTPHPEMAGVAWMAVELTDRAAVAAALAELRPSEIYHLAGVPHVGDSWAHAEETLSGNVIGTLNVFDGVRATGTTPRVLVTGSATIYRPSTAALTEASPVAPNSPYGTSKLAQEMVALGAWRDHHIPVVVTRSFNHIGPLQAPSFAAPGFARQLARIEAGLLPPTLLVGNLDAERDLTDVRDTVRAYRALMAAGHAGSVYNVCSGRAVSMRVMLDMLCTMVRVPVTVATDPARMRPADTPVVLGDRTRLSTDTGWEPTYALETTLADLVDYWREQTRAETR